MGTRRNFLHGLAASLGSPLLAAGAAPPRPAAPATGSDVGSLFPFIQAQAVKKDFPLSFLHGSFTEVAAWKRRARGKLLELLHYAPAECDPRAEVVERSDRGDHVREKVYFNTTPDVRVPAYVLVPKKADRPLPGLDADPHGQDRLDALEERLRDNTVTPPADQAAFRIDYPRWLSLGWGIATSGSPRRWRWARPPWSWRRSTRSAGDASASCGASSSPTGSASTARWCDGHSTRHQPAAARPAPTGTSVS